VVGSRIGGLPAIIDDGVTGALFDPGNAADLAGQLQPLWDDPARCLRMGLAGREKVIRNYTEATYFNNLMNVYQTAIGRIARGAGFLPVTSLGARRAEAIPASRS
jgi:glycosyltransferase involved in cell wall biosynthesis